MFVVMIMLMRCPMMMTHTACRAHTKLRQPPIQLSLARKLSCTLTSVLATATMPTLSKAEWMQRLAEAGIQAPKSWTIPQLRALWEDLQEEKGKTAQAGLQEHLQKLRTASRKKAELITFLELEGMEINPNHTIPDLFRAGEKMITEKYEPTGTELVGFGQYANAKYQDVRVKYPSYATWVMTTAQESKESGWRLRRLATWLIKNQDAPFMDALPPQSSRNHKSFEKESVHSFSLVTSGSEVESSHDKTDKDAEIAALKEKIAQLEEDNRSDLLQKNRSKTRRET